MTRGQVEVESASGGVPVHTTTGTPPPLADAGTADALETIELNTVLARVAGFAAGPLGAERVLARRPTDDIAWIRMELGRVHEVAVLFRKGDGLLAASVPEVTAALARLRIEGSVLEGTELAAIHRALVATQAVHADLTRVAPQTPRAAELLRPLPDRRIERRLEQSVDGDGTLLDSASPRLAAARREVQDARNRLIRRLEALLRGLESNAVPANATVTVRDGRYVIPVRRDSRARPSGIVHGESGSAGTLFVEPTEAIDLGNALREAQLEEERETLRVLREITDLLRPALSVIRDAIEMAIAVDDLVARARYAVAIEGNLPEVALAPASLAVRNGRHPLLIAGPTPVVPFDLDLDQTERTLLVSGPNTGGKTVLLKAVALFAALAQSGIVPPVGPESRLPVFGRFFADIGDRQSIAASLSTFSAHVAMLRRILDDADATSVVLLDEVGSGTDPTEGGALAAATLTALTTRGALSFATTHLGALKDLAAHTAGVVNASLEFDSATLTPTYRLAKGVPGRSYGLAIAKRLGVSADVLADAEARIPQTEKTLDQLLASVEERARELDADRAELEARRAEADALAARLSAQAEAQAVREATLRKQEKEAERRAREQARAFLLSARTRVEEALGAARSVADAAAAREVRRLVEEGIAAEAQALAETEAGTPADSGVGVEVGSRVRIGSGGVGRVAEIRSDGKLVVVVGAIRMVVEAATVTVVAGGREKGERGETGERGGKGTGARADFTPSSPASFEIDLRGMTGDEAEAATVAAVDAAVLAEHPYLRIIHGMGTGVVRERVHRVVRGDRRVARFGFAPRNQGGTGVTIVEFPA
ncbi:MAG TPA: Smr/MutS family protein [Gemmatimonadales bacterium]|nr:Smr/MutS family protein [Gemmatimonadales bacterium]